MRNRFSPIIKGISAVIIAAFLAQDIAWAHPDLFSQIKTTDNKLAAHSFFQEAGSEGRANGFFIEQLIENQPAFRSSVSLAAIAHILKRPEIRNWLSGNNITYTCERHANGQISEILIHLPAHALRYFDPQLSPPDKYPDWIEVQDGRSSLKNIRRQVFPRPGLETASRVSSSGSESDPPIRQLPRAVAQTEIERFLKKGLEVSGGVVPAHKASDGTLIITYSNILEMATAPVIYPQDKTKEDIFRIRVFLDLMKEHKVEFFGLKKKARPGLIKILKENCSTKEWERTRKASDYYYRNKENTDLVVSENSEYAYALLKRLDVDFAERTDFVLKVEAAADKARKAKKEPGIDPAERVRFISMLRDAMEDLGPAKATFLAIAQAMGFAAYSGLYKKAKRLHVDLSDFPILKKPGGTRKGTAPPNKKWTPEGVFRELKMMHEEDPNVDLSFTGLQLKQRLYIYYAARDQFPGMYWRDILKKAFGADVMKKHPDWYRKEKPEAVRRSASGAELEPAAENPMQSASDELSGPESPMAGDLVPAVASNTPESRPSGRRLFFQQYVLYLVRWEVTTFIPLWPVIYVFGKGLWQTALANLIGGFIFFRVDRRILSAKNKKSADAGFSLIRFLLYLGRWQLSTPGLNRLIAHFGTGVRSIMLANLIGGLVFFWLDRLIFDKRSSVTRVYNVVSKFSFPLIVSALSFCSVLLDKRHTDTAMIAVPLGVFAAARAFQYGLTRIAKKYEIPIENSLRELSGMPLRPQDEAGNVPQGGTSADDGAERASASGFNERRVTPSTLSSIVATTGEEIATPLKISGRVCLSSYGDGPDTSEPVRKPKIQMPPITLAYFSSVFGYHYPHQLKLYHIVEALSSWATPGAKRESASGASQNGASLGRLEEHRENLWRSFCAALGVTEDELLNEVYPVEEITHPFVPGRKISIPDERGPVVDITGTRGTRNAVKALIPLTLLERLISETKRPDKPLTCGVGARNWPHYNVFENRFYIGQKYASVFLHEIGHIIFYRCLIRDTDKINIHRFLEGFEYERQILGREEVPGLVARYQDLIGAQNPQYLKGTTPLWPNSVSEHFAVNIERLAYGAPFLICANSKTTTEDLLNFFVDAGIINQNEAWDYLFLSCRLNDNKPVEPIKQDRVKGVTYGFPLQAYAENRILTKEKELGRGLGLDEEIAVRLDEPVQDIRLWMKKDSWRLFEVLKLLHIDSKGLEQRIQVASAADSPRRRRGSASGGSWDMGNGLWDMGEESAAQAPAGRILARSSKLKAQSITTEPLDTKSKIEYGVLNGSAVGNNPRKLLGMLGMAGDGKKSDSKNENQYADQEKIYSGHNQSPSLLSSVATTNVAVNTRNPTKNTPNLNDVPDTNWPITSTTNTSLPTSYKALDNSSRCVLPNLSIDQSISHATGAVKDGDSAQRKSASGGMNDFDQYKLYAETKDKAYREEMLQKAYYAEDNFTYVIARARAIAENILKNMPENAPDETKLYVEDAFKKLDGLIICISDPSLIGNDTLASMSERFSQGSELFAVLLKATERNVVDSKKLKEKIEALKGAKGVFNKDNAAVPMPLSHYKQISETGYVAESSRLATKLGSFPDTERPAVMMALLDEDALEYNLVSQIKREGGPQIVFRNPAAASDAYITMQISDGMNDGLTGLACEVRVTINGDTQNPVVVKRSDESEKLEDLVLQALVDLKKTTEWDAFTKDSKDRDGSGANLETVPRAIPEVSPSTERDSASGNVAHGSWFMVHEGKKGGSGEWTEDKSSTQLLQELLALLERILTDGTIEGLAIKRSDFRLTGEVRQFKDRPPDQKVFWIWIDDASDATTGLSETLIGKDGRGTLLNNIAGALKISWSKSHGGQDIRLILNTGTFREDRVRQLRGEISRAVSDTLSKKTNNRVILFGLNEISISRRFLIEEMNAISVKHRNEAIYDGIDCRHSKESGSHVIIVFPKKVVRKSAASIPSAKDITITSERRSELEKQAFDVIELVTSEETEALIFLELPDEEPIVKKVLDDFRTASDGRVLYDYVLPDFKKSRPFFSVSSMNKYEGANKKRMSSSGKEEGESRGDGKRGISDVLNEIALNYNWLNHSCSRPIIGNRMPLAEERIGQIKDDNLVADEMYMVVRQRDIVDGHEDMYGVLVEAAPGYYGIERKQGKVPYDIYVAQIGEALLLWKDPVVRQDDYKGFIFLEFDEYGYLSSNDYQFLTRDDRLKMYPWLPDLLHQRLELLLDKPFNPLCGYFKATLEEAAMDTLSYIDVMPYPSDFQEADYHYSFGFKLRNLGYIWPLFRPQQDIMPDHEQSNGAVNIAIYGAYSEDDLAIMQAASYRDLCNLFIVNPPLDFRRGPKGKEVAFGCPELIFSNGRAVILSCTDFVPLHYVIDRHGIYENRLRKIGLPLPDHKNSEDYIGQKDINMIALEAYGMEVPRWRSFIVSSEDDKIRNIRKGCAQVRFFDISLDDTEHLLAEELGSFLEENRIERAVLKPNDLSCGRGVKFFDRNNLEEAASEAARSIRQGQNMIAQERIVPEFINYNGMLFDYNFRNFVAAGKEGAPVFSDLVVRIGKEGQAINISRDAKAVLLEDIAEVLGLSESDAMELRRINEEASRGAYNAITQMMTRNGALEKFEDPTDFMGVDTIVTRKGGRLVPYVIEVNDSQSGAMWDLDRRLAEVPDSLVPARESAERVGRSMNDWLSTMIYRARVYKYKAFGIPSPASEKPAPDGAFRASASGSRDAGESASNGVPEELTTKKEDTLRRLENMIEKDALDQEDEALLQKLFGFFRLKSESWDYLKREFDRAAGRRYVNRRIAELTILITNFETKTYDIDIPDELGRRYMDIAAQFDSDKFCHSLSHSPMPYGVLKLIADYPGDKYGKAKELLKEGETANNTLMYLCNPIVVNSEYYKDPHLALYMIDLLIKTLEGIVIFDDKCYEFLSAIPPADLQEDAGIGDLIASVPNNIAETKMWLAKIKLAKEKGIAEAEKETTVIELKKIFDDHIFSRMSKDTPIYPLLEIKSGTDPLAILPISKSDLEYLADNLISNSVDAMRKGMKFEIKVEISSCAEGKKDYIEVKYSDTGKGMAKDVLERVRRGESFTTKGDMGSGKGILIIFDIVKRCGGTIKIDSEIDKGTTFTIRLPIITRPLPVAEEAESPQEASPSIILTEAIRKTAQLARDKDCIEKLKARCPKITDRFNYCLAVECARYLLMKQAPIKHMWFYPSYCPDHNIGPNPMIDIRFDVTETNRDELKALIRAIDRVITSQYNTITGEAIESLISFDVADNNRKYSLKDNMPIHVIIDGRLSDYKDSSGANSKPVPQVIPKVSPDAKRESASGDASYKIAGQASAAEIVEILNKAELKIEEVLKDPMKFYDEVWINGKDDPVTLSEHVKVFDYLWTAKNIGIPFPNTLRDKLIEKKSDLIGRIFLYGMNAENIVELKSQISLSEDELEFAWSVFRHDYPRYSNRHFGEFSWLRRMAIEEAIGIYPEDKIVRVLDLGCGPRAQALRDIKQKYGKRVQAFGVDLAIENNGNYDIHLLRGDIKNLPFGDNSFEVIYENAVMEYFAPLGFVEFATTLSEIARVLSPGGRLILTSVPPYEIKSAMCILGEWEFIFQITDEYVIACKKNIADNGHQDKTGSANDIERMSSSGSRDAGSPITDYGNSAKRESASGFNVGRGTWHVGRKERAISEGAPLADSTGKRASASGFNVGRRTWHVGRQDGAQDDRSVSPGAASQIDSSEKRDSASGFAEDSEISSKLKAQSSKGEEPAARAPEAGEAGATQEASPKVDLTSTKIIANPAQDLCEMLYSYNKKEDILSDHGRNVLACLRKGDASPDILNFDIKRLGGLIYPQVVEQLVLPLHLGGLNNGKNSLFISPEEYMRRIKRTPGALLSYRLDTEAEIIRLVDGCNNNCMFCCLNGRRPVQSLPYPIATQCIIESHLGVNRVKGYETRLEYYNNFLGPDTFHYHDEVCGANIAHVFLFEQRFPNPHPIKQWLATAGYSPLDPSMEYVRAAIKQLQTMKIPADKYFVFHCTYNLFWPEIEEAILRKDKEKLMEAVGAYMQMYKELFLCQRGLTIFNRKTSEDDTSLPKVIKIIDKVQTQALTYLKNDDEVKMASASFSDMFIDWTLGRKAMSTLERLREVEADDPELIDFLDSLDIEKVVAKAWAGKANGEDGAIPESATQPEGGAKRESASGSRDAGLPQEPSSIVTEKDISIVLNRGDRPLDKYCEFTKENWYEKAAAAVLGNISTLLGLPQNGREALESKKSELSHLINRSVNNSMDSIAQRFDQEEGFERGEVRIETYLQDEDVIVDIMDNGTGNISEGQTPWKRANRDRLGLLGATGVDMEYIYSLARVLGGVAELVINNREKGAILRLKIPVINLVGDNSTGENGIILGSAIPLEDGAGRGSASGPYKRMTEMVWDGRVVIPDGESASYVIKEIALIALAQNDSRRPADIFTDFIKDDKTRAEKVAEKLFEIIIDSKEDDAVRTFISNMCWDVLKKRAGLKYFAPIVLGKMVKLQLDGYHLSKLSEEELNIINIADWGQEVNHDFEHTIDDLLRELPSLKEVFEPHLYSTMFNIENEAWEKRVAFKWRWKSMDGESGFISPDKARNSTDELCLYYREQLPFLYQMKKAMAEAAPTDKRLISHLKNIEICIGNAEYFLDIVKDGKKKKDTMKEVDINDLLRSLIGSMDRPESAKKIKYVEEYGHDLPKIFGNRNMLRSLFMNLINNARDAMQGRESEVITVRTRREEDSVIIEVADTGKGIPREIEPYVFMRFFTTKGKRGGTGLGLAICEKIVKSHGGEINFASEVGKGTTFAVKLPAVSSRESAPRQNSSGQAPRPGSGQASGEDYGEMRGLALEVSNVYKDVQDAFPNDIEAYKKEDTTPITIVDYLVQLKTALMIRKLYPEDEFLGEENIDIAYLKEKLDKELLKKYGADIDEFEELMKKDTVRGLENPNYWIVDPLDGTRNYIEGSGKFAFSLARVAWNKEGRVYEPDYALIYAPQYEISYDGQLVFGPLAECSKDNYGVTLWSANPEQGGGLTKAAEGIRFDRKDDDRPWKIILRDRKSPVLAPNPYQQVFVPAYGNDNIISDWESSVIGMLEVLLGNFAIYHSDMNIWDHAAAAFMIQKAGGEAYRTDNGQPLRGYTIEDVERGKAKEKFDIIASRGGSHIIPQEVFSSAKRDSASGARQNGTFPASNIISFDSRPVTAKLLHQAYVEHDMMVKRLINPDNKKLRALYGGAGVDISNFLLTTNATTAYFVSEYHNLSVNDLKNLKGYKSSWMADAYKIMKFFNGYSTSPELSTKEEVLAGLACELEALGVDLDTIVVDSDNGYPRIKFKWSYKGTEEQYYEVTFIDTDITKPEEYPAALTDALKCGLDVYYQRAGFKIAHSYACIDTERSFIEYLNEFLNKGGYFVTDDLAFCYDEKVDKKTYVDYGPTFPVHLKRVPISGNSSIERAIRSLRHSKWPTIHPSAYRYGWYVRIRRKDTISVERGGPEGATQPDEDVKRESASGNVAHGSWFMVHEGKKGGSAEWLEDKSSTQLLQELLALLERILTDGTIEGLAIKRSDFRLTGEVRQFKDRPPDQKVFWIWIDDASDATTGLSETLIGKDGRGTLLNNIAGALKISWSKSHGGQDIRLILNTGTFREDRVRQLRGDISRAVSDTLSKKTNSRVILFGLNEISLSRRFLIEEVNAISVKHRNEAIYDGIDYRHSKESGSHVIIVFPKKVVRKSAAPIPSAKDVTITSERRGELEKQTYDVIDMVTGEETEALIFLELPDEEPIVKRVLDDFRTASDGRALYDYVLPDFKKSRPFFSVSSMNRYEETDKNRMSSSGEGREPKIGDRDPVVERKAEGLSQNGASPEEDKYPDKREISHDKTSFKNIYKQVLSNSGARSEGRRLSASGEFEKDPTIATWSKDDLKKIRLALEKKIRRADGFRHSVRNAIKRHEKVSIYNEALDIYYEVVDEIRSSPMTKYLTDLLIDALNGAGYAANEMARFSLFDLKGGLLLRWDEMSDGEKIGCENSIRKIEYWLLRAALPNFETVSSKYKKSKAESGVSKMDITAMIKLTKGIPRALAGYVFGMNIRIELELALAQLKPGEADEYLYNALRYASISIRRAAEGLKADHERRNAAKGGNAQDSNEHILSALAESCAILDEVLGRLGSPRTTKAAKARFDTLRNMQKNLDYALSSLKVNKDIESRVEKTADRISAQMERLKNLIEVVNSLGELFIKVAIEENYGDREEFDILFHLYVEDKYPQFKEELSDVANIFNMFDLCDLAVIRILSLPKNRDRLWRINELVKEIRGVAAGAKTNEKDISERLSDGRYLMLGLEPSVVEEETVGFGEEPLRTLKLKTAKEEVARAEAMLADILNLLSRIKPWIMSEDHERLEGHYNRAREKVGVFREKIAQVDAKNSPEKEDLLELSKLSKGYTGSEGYKTVLERAGYKVELRKKGVVQAIEELKGAVSACQRRIEALYNAVKMQEIEVLCDRIHEISGAAQNLLLPASADYLSIDIYRELCEEIPNLSEEVESLTPKVHKWVELNGRTENVKTRLSSMAFVTEEASGLIQAAIGLCKKLHANLERAMDIEEAGIEEEISLLEADCRSALSASTAAAEPISDIDSLLGEISGFADFFTHGSDKIFYEEILKIAHDFKAGLVEALKSVKDARESDEVAKEAKRVSNMVHEGITLLREQRSRILLEKAYPAFLYMAMYIYALRTRLAGFDERYHSRNIWKLLDDAEKIINDILTADLSSGENKPWEDNAVPLRDVLNEIVLRNGWDAALDKFILENCDSGKKVEDLPNEMLRYIFKLPNKSCEKTLRIKDRLGLFFRLNYKGKVFMDEESVLILAEVLANDFLKASQPPDLIKVSKKYIKIVQENVRHALGLSIGKGLREEKIEEFLLRNIENAEDFAKTFPLDKYIRTFSPEHPTRRFSPSGADTPDTPISGKKGGSYGEQPSVPIESGAVYEALAPKTAAATVFTKSTSTVSQFLYDLREITRQGLKDHPLREGSRIVLSENLFIGKDGDRSELDVIKEVALKPLLESGVVAIADLEELRRIATNANAKKTSKEKVAVVMTDADYNNKIWNGSKERSIKSSVLILDNDTKLTASNYLYLEGIIGLARAIMANNKPAIRRYYQRLSGTVIDDDILELLDDDTSENNIAFAVKAILKLKPMLPIDSEDKMKGYKIDMESYLVAA